MTIWISDRRKVATTPVEGGIYLAMEYVANPHAMVYETPREVWHRYDIVGDVSQTPTERSPHVAHA